MKNQNNNEALLRAIWQVSDEKVAESESELLTPLPCRKRRFIALKAAAVAAAAALILTVGVGAFTGSYTGVFGMLFGGENGGEVEMFDLGHTVRPEVTNMVSETDNLELEVLGIAGDNRMLYLVFELTAKNGYTLNTPEYFLSVSGFEPFEAAQNMSEHRGWGVSSNGFNILERGENSVIIAQVFHYGEVCLENGSGGLSQGHVSMELNARGTTEPIINLISFDILLDYDFGAVRTLELGERYEFAKGDTTVSHLVTKLEITPISVRFTIEYESMPDRDNSLFLFEMPWIITFVNGETMSFDHDRFECPTSRLYGVGVFDGEGGSGFQEFVAAFERPFDVSQVYSVTLGENVFVF
jgi:hypothetical protein